jgi:hypothetical protein
VPIESQGEANSCNKFMSCIIRTLQSVYVALNQLRSIDDPAVIQEPLPRPVGNDVVRCHTARMYVGRKNKQKRKPQNKRHVQRPVYPADVRGACRFTRHSSNVSRKPRAALATNHNKKTNKPKEAQLKEALIESRDDFPTHLSQCARYALPQQACRLSALPRCACRGAY